MWVGVLHLCYNLSYCFLLTRITRAHTMTSQCIWSNPFGHSANFIARSIFQNTINLTPHEVFVLQAKINRYILSTDEWQRMLSCLNCHCEEKKQASSPSTHHLDLSCFQTSTTDCPH